MLMQGLLDYLNSAGVGPIEDVRSVQQLLVDCWEEFSNSDAEGMTAYKLSGRMENVQWDPPHLTFEIERHGATVMGSSRAAVHQWVLDLSNRTAHCEEVGHRQLTPMAKRLDVKPMAREVADLIISRRHDDRLKWNEDGTVTVHIGRILPESSAVPQTLTARRKRFRRALEDLVAAAGWGTVRPNVYSPPAVQEN